MKKHDFEEIGKALVKYHELNTAAQSAKESLDRLLLGSVATPVDPVYAAIVDDQLDFFASQDRWVWLTSKEVCSLIGLKRIDQGVMRKVRRCVLDKNGGQARRAANANQVLCPPMKNEPEY